MADKFWIPNIGNLHIGKEYYYKLESGRIDPYCELHCVDITPYDVSALKKTMRLVFVRNGGHIEFKFPLCEPIIKLCEREVYDDTLIEMPDPRTHIPTDAKNSIVIGDEILQPDTLAIGTFVYYTHEAYKKVYKLKLLEINKLEDHAGVKCLIFEKSDMSVWYHYPGHFPVGKYYQVLW
jgi:hypothetical protein